VFKKYLNTVITPSSFWVLSI